MPRLLRRGRRCHYCNGSSPAPASAPAVPRSWLCPHCDAVNHLDHHGNITDPPVHETSSPPPAPSFHYARSRSPTPVMSAPAESPFCDTCQRNQLLLNKTLAEYIPDEDDPEYQRYVDSVDAYRAELEQRYPQVCDNCIGRVQDQIRAAGYAAKTDHLRRILAKSNQAKDKAFTSRQLSTLRLIRLAKWTYLCSILAGLVWHGFGAMVALDAGIEGDDQFTWTVCLTQAIRIHQVDQSCVMSPYIRRWVQWALAADLLTIWWNPRLSQKTNSIGGRMHGLTRVWIIRLTTAALRVATFYHWGDVMLVHEAQDGLIHMIHGIMAVMLLVSTMLTWTIVRIDYTYAANMRSGNEHLPSAPQSTGKSSPSQYKPVRPDPANAPFDSMAQSFTSSFQMDNPLEGQTEYPPSPTLTSASHYSYDSDFGTPHLARTVDSMGDDGMDWTPTQKRFTANAPSVLPSIWSQRQSSPSPQPVTTNAHEPHSLFSKPDPNPFRHKVPPAPKPPAQSKVDPWKPGVWTPSLQSTSQNFFKDGRNLGIGPESESGNGLEGAGVPKRVRRDAELFAKPQLKYENYTTPKETGLETSFNDLFAK